MPRARTLFLLFFASGFCGLLYQVVWLRLAFASFGITTAVLSIVVSVFMAGLGVGSWLAGRLAQRWKRRTGRSALELYALVELGIGTGAVAVPWLFDAFARSLLPVGSLDGAQYHLLSAVLLAVAMLPWCLLMGTTFPLVMSFVRDRAPDASRSSFSFLYVANVVGAATGTVTTGLVLVELLGFRATLLVAGAVNALVAAGAWRIAAASRTPAPAASPAAAGPAAVRAAGPASRLAPWALFTTGFCSMAFEVVWTRSYTPVLRTYVYSFASLLTVYLAATFAGSWLHRRSLSAGRSLSPSVLLGLVLLTSLLPAFTGDPRALGILAGLVPPSVAVLAGIVPFCAVLGLLTPRLVDEMSLGDPDRAGRAYAVNVAGCIVGPLCAGYLLLPLLGARLAVVAMAVPLAALCVAALLSETRGRVRGGALLAASAATAAAALLVVRSFEEGAQVRGAKVVRRDHTATVISFGEGLGKKLLVNGVGITAMDRCTKFMAHLPMACHPRPERTLVICFGMGTTFRSLRTWGADVTAVELVPSVRDAFPYYFDDAAGLLADPCCRIVVDDGRRFLQRTSETFDVVTLDPPPPVEAAGSSLLYTREFYALVRSRLRPGGILQAWFPGMPSDDGTYGAVLRSLADEFPHVRVLRSTKPHALHFLASEGPIPIPDAEAFVARMPEAARRDLVEWNDGAERDPVAYVRALLAMEEPVGPLLARAGDERITDDRPFNEYYLLRRWFAGR